MLGLGDLGTKLLSRSLEHRSKLMKICSTVRGEIDESPVVTGDQTLSKWLEPPVLVLLSHDQSP